MCLDQDKRSRSTFGCVFTKMNGQDKILDAFWSWWTVKIDFQMFFDQHQRSWSNFGCILSVINAQYQLLDTFWPWSTIKISFWMFLAIINGQDWLLEAFWPWSIVIINFWILFNPDQRSRTTFGFSMRFYPKQLSRWAFYCLSINIISEDWILDALWLWSHVKIHFWTSFNKDERSRSTFGCVLTVVEG